MPITVVAILNIRPNSEQAARDILTCAVTAVHEEPGCSLYSLHEADGRFVFVEEWADEDALNTHNAGPAVTRMVDEIGPHLDGAPEIILAQPFAGGNPAKGRLRP